VDHASADVPELPALSEDQRRDLKRGRRVQMQDRDGSTGRGCAVVEVDAPRSLVLSTLSNFGNYNKMIGTVRDSKVVSMNRCSKGLVHARCEYKISKLQLGVNTVHQVDPVAGTVRFDLDPDVGSSVLQEASGVWQIEEISAGRCRVWLSIGLRASPFLPGVFVDYAAPRALKRATEWLKPHVEDLWQKDALRIARDTEAGIESMDLLGGRRSRASSPQRASVMA